MKYREALQSLRETCWLLEKHNALHKGQGLAVTSALDCTDRREIKALHRESGWFIRIQESPIEFLCEDPSMKHLRVDISGMCWAPKDGGPGQPTTGLQGHSITMRVWSTREADWLNRRRDHHELVNRIRNRGRGRVMVRVHFDREPEGGGGPWSHMQVGGTADDGEFYPYPPPGFDVPRFLHPPMDFVLALEFVTRTFGGEVYDSVKNDPTWMGAVRRSQREYTRAYYDQLRRENLVVDTARSLLDLCWECPF